MKIKTQNLKQYTKLLSMIPQTPLDDFVYLEPKEKKLYMSNKNIACLINIDIDDVQEQDTTMVIDRGMFQHLISAGEELILDNKYNYKISDISGVIEHNDILIDSVQSIKTIFSSNNFELKLVLDTMKMNKLVMASYFVNPMDTNYAQRGVHIFTDTIASSSLFRIYIDSFESEYSMFLQHDILKFIFEIGENTSILQNEQTKSIKITNTDIEIIFTSITNVSPLPINSEKFVNTISSLKQDTKVMVNINSFLDKINFMQFFAKKNINNLSLCTIDKVNNQLSITVGNNNTHVSCKGIESSKETLEFYYDNAMVGDILNKIGKGKDTVTLYCSEEHNIYILSFNDNQFVALSKIKI